MTTPNPNNVAFAVQARQINAKLDRTGVVTDQRRRNARKLGYNGPLTRQQLASMVAPTVTSNASAKRIAR